MFQVLIILLLTKKSAGCAGFSYFLVVRCAISKMGSKCQPIIPVEDGKYQTVVRNHQTCCLSSKTDPILTLPQFITSRNQGCLTRATVIHLPQPDLLFTAVRCSDLIYCDAHLLATGVFSYQALIGKPELPNFFAIKRIMSQLEC